MKYKKIKEYLLSNGYELKYIQTNNILDILSFFKKGIQVDLTFDDENIKEEDVFNDVVEICYETSDILNDVEISNIIIISDYFQYQNEDFIDVDEDDNRCSLYKENLESVYYILDSLKDFVSINNSIIKHERNVNTYFNIAIKEYLRVLDKYDMKLYISKKDNISNITYHIRYKNYQAVSFNYDWLKELTTIDICLMEHLLKDEIDEYHRNSGMSFILDNYSVEEFEKEIDIRIKYCDDFITKYRNK